jgi:hypothetical protein
MADTGMMGIEDDKAAKKLKPKKKMAENKNNNSFIYNTKFVDNKKDFVYLI